MATHSGSNIRTGYPAVSTWPPAGSTMINVGDNWQTKVNAGTTGTVFAVAAGTHTQQGVTPKNGQQFIGPPGTSGTYGPTGLTAIMDGQNTTKTAFNGASSDISDVVIKNLEIKNYQSDQQFSAIDMSAYPGHNSTGWLVDSCYIHHNAYCGVCLHSGSTMIHSRTAYNAYQGYRSEFASDVTFTYCEIDHNHTAGDDPIVEAGGGKVRDSTRLTMSHNWSHHNSPGPAMWTDINNFQSLYEYNLVEDCDQGIFHEISYDAIIRYNTFNRIGVNWGSRPWAAAVLIAASGGVGSGIVDIHGNVYEGNYMSVSLMQQNRGSGSMGDWLVRNVTVHDETVNNQVLGSGATQDLGDNAIFTSRGNTFTHNTYVHGPNRFIWNNADNSFATWQGTYGMDTTGSYTP